MFGGGQNTVYSIPCLLDEFILFFKIVKGKITSAARNLISFAPPSGSDDLYLFFCLYPAAMTTPLPSVAALFRDDLQAGERDELQPGERDLQDAPQIPGTQEHCQEPPGRYTSSVSVTRFFA